jgi:hypothetical protein
MDPAASLKPDAPSSNGLCACPKRQTDPNTVFATLERRGNAAMLNDLACIAQSGLAFDKLPVKPCGLRVRA